MPSSDHDVTTCDTCGSRIRWTTTAAGKALAVDADPAEDGNQAVYRDGAGRLRSRGLSSDRPTLEHAEWRARPHVASCSRPRPRRTTAPRQRAGVRPPHWRWQR